jgi:hypothetical protein
MQAINSHGLGMAWHGIKYALNSAREINLNANAERKIRNCNLLNTLFVQFSILLSLHFVSF